MVSRCCRRPKWRRPEPTDGSVAAAAGRAAAARLARRVAGSHRFCFFKILVLFGVGCCVATKANHGWVNLGASAGRQRRFNGLVGRTRRRRTAGSRRRGAGRCRPSHSSGCSTRSQSPRKEHCRRPVLRRQRIFRPPKQRFAQFSGNKI